MSDRMAGRRVTTGAQVRVRPSPLSTEPVHIDPSALRPGTHVQHKNGELVILERRKADDSGWWLRHGGGLADRVILSGDWKVHLTDSLHDTMVREGWTRRMIGAAMDAAAFCREAESTEG